MIECDLREDTLESVATVHPFTAGLNSGLYFGEGKLREGAAEGGGALAGLLPVPGGRALGRRLGGKLLPEPKPRPAAKPGAVGDQHRRARRQEKDAERREKYERRAGKIVGDALSGQAYGNTVKDTVSGKNPLGRAAEDAISGDDDDQ